MNLGSILFIIAVFILTILYLAYPYLKNTDQKASGVEKLDRQQIADEHVLKLLNDREKLLYQLEELETDYQTNKINEEDYPQLRETILQNGAMIMHRLDEMGFSEKNGTIFSSEDISKTPELFHSQPDRQKIQEKTDEFEKLIDNRKRNRNERTSGFCTKCGSPLQKSDRFCPKCGTVKRTIESE